MQCIQISVVRDSRFRSVDGFHIFGDRGTGTIDWAHPITPRRVLFWEDALPMLPHLLGGHVMGHHLDSIFREGHLAGTHLLDGHQQPAGVSVFETESLVYGRFRFVVLPMDELGNQRFWEATTHECVVNSYPPPASNFVAETYDQDTGVLTFSFTPSEKLVG